jgi:sugar (pentulose or hexulose) kinase
MDLRNTCLGMEFGSTRIKLVLIDRDHRTLAQGSFEWENRLENGIWTYHYDEIDEGLRAAYRALKDDIKEKYAIVLDTFGAMGISAMMHGYLPLDRDMKPLTAFRTWRNTMTEEAAETLSDLFDFNIPQRWSIAHLYQAILNGEEHVRDISVLTTLAGYMHLRLTGRNILGVGEASGMFPISEDGRSYDAGDIVKFRELIKDREYPWDIGDILPKFLLAGENAGCLTEEGALLLDPEGDLRPGIPFAPCEGDAETGMVGTNSVRERTGNVSAGTSDFAMVVLEGKIKRHMEVGIVATPAGKPVAMVHCTNCTSDINSWVDLFLEFAELSGTKITRTDAFNILFEKALEGEKDGGDLLHYNYFSGEAIIGMNEGRPVFTRLPGSRMNVADFMRSCLMSALSTLKIGMDILISSEHVRIDRMLGQGGFFKVPGPGQRILSAAIAAPVSVMETAAEGGPYGMAILCAYMLFKDEGESLEDYLDNRVFRDAKTTEIMATEEDIEGFNTYLERYKKAFVLEKKAVEVVF